MIPSIGRIVYYRLTESDARRVAKRRADGRGAAGIAAENSGAIVHHGNPVSEGDVYPLVITRVFDDEPTERSVVNGQVLLDGNDTLWVTSRSQGDGLGNWSAPPRV